MSEETALLRAFVADETEALSEQRQGKFWPRNHHRISPLVAKVSHLLDASERVDFYFHYMRVSGGVPAVSDKEMPLLLDAYKRQIPILDLLGVIQMGRRHELLFIFGFDEAGTLPSGETDSAKALKERLKLVSQVNAYTSQPSQREKKKRFVPFSSQAERVLETLRHLGYRHSRCVVEEAYDITNLGFWGMVFICLLGHTTRAGLVADMLDGDYHLVRRDEQLSMLHRYVVEVLPDVDDEGPFQALAARLAQLELDRRAATESHALAKSLGLPFGLDEDWDIAITIPLQGSKENVLLARNSVQLLISAQPDWQWRLRAELSEKGSHVESNERVSRNELGLPVLGAGSLHAFPAWLKQVRGEKGISFDIEAADIRVGRKRAAVKILSRWLADA